MIKILYQNLWHLSNVKNLFPPKVLQITDLILSLAIVNFPLFGTDKAFCFLHCLTPSIKADLNLKQALYTSAITKTLISPSASISYMSVLNMIQYPVSSEISDLCEISDLLLFLNYFTFQNKEIKFGNHFFNVCCVN